jgi:hypothetical protein
MDMPEAPAPPGVETSGSAAPAALGASPGALGGGALPGVMSAGAAPMASLMGPAPGIPTALIKEAVQAAVQREAERLAAEKLAAEKLAGDDKEAVDTRAEDERTEDKDGDGKPDDDAKRGEKTDEPVAAAGGIDAGRPPVHIEMDVDVERLNTPITVTFDRESPIGPPPAPAP